MKLINALLLSSPVVAAASRNKQFPDKQAALRCGTTMQKCMSSIVLSTALSAIVVHAEEVDCLAVSQSVVFEVSTDTSQVLEIVSKEVAAAPSCACEIVKSAIKASEGDSLTVAAIVEVAISMAPEQMRLISQCAIATAPDAIAEILAVLAKLDPNSGDSIDGSKSGDSKDGSKSGKDATAAMVAPSEGSPNPLNLVSLSPPSLTPPIDPPVITDPNPQKLSAP